MSLTAIINNLSFAQQKKSIITDPNFALETLFSYITCKTGLSLSDNEKSDIKAVAKGKCFRRRQYLLQEGDICKYLCFIASGAMRMYAVNDKGQESIISFGIEENWIADQESLSLQQPSLYNIEAVEESSVLMVSHLQFRDLACRIPAIDLMLRQHTRQQAIATQKRIHSVISMSAEERYQELSVCHPEYLQRFSQNMLAAYLGIKPETLSRVRSRC